MKEFKRYIVYYRNGHYPLEGVRSKFVEAASKQAIRRNWQVLMQTDQYVIVRIEGGKS